MKTDLRGTGLHPEGTFRALITKATADAYKSGPDEGLPVLKLALTTEAGMLWDNIGTTPKVSAKTGKQYGAFRFVELLEALGYDPEDIGEDWNEQEIVDDEVVLEISHYTNQTSGKKSTNIKYSAVV